MGLSRRDFFKVVPGGTAALLLGFDAAPDLALLYKRRQQLGQIAIDDHVAVGDFDGSFD